MEVRSTKVTVIIQHMRHNVAYSKTFYVLKKVQPPKKIYSKNYLIAKLMLALFYKSTMSLVVGDFASFSTIFKH